MKNDNNTYDIFLSYRRVGGFETAKHLFDLLVRDGYRVSFDIDTLRSGDFDIQLLHRIDQCTDFILILNAGAFDRSIDPASDRNKDWMRIELAYALEKKEKHNTHYAKWVYRLSRQSTGRHCRCGAKERAQIRQLLLRRFLSQAAPVSRIRADH